MAEIQWVRDPDEGLEQAKSAKNKKMVLLDLTAAPM